MRRIFAVLALAIATAGIVFGQTDRLSVFRSNFAGANLQTKLEIVRSADREDPAEFGAFYLDALNYVNSNISQMTREPLLRQIALIAIERVDEGAYVPAARALWDLYSGYPETSMRIQILGVLGSIADGEQAIIDRMNEWVIRQNNLTRGGERVELQVVAAAVTALGVIGDPTSFDSILDVILIEYPDFVESAAAGALRQIEGDQQALALAAVSARDVLDRGPAFAFLVDSGYFEGEARFAFARRVMEDALRTTSGSLREQEALRQLRYRAAEILREGAYADATAAVIGHFNQTVLEFERGQTARTRLLEAIATLGAMGNEAAAVRLTQYLELINTYTERDRPYDSQLLLATITNLELLGDPQSYNALFFTSILDSYPDIVRDAARAAMDVVAE